MSPVWCSLTVTAVPVVSTAGAGAPAYGPLPGDSPTGGAVAVAVVTFEGSFVTSITVSVAGACWTVVC